MKEGPLLFLDAEPRPGGSELAGGGGKTNSSPSYSPWANASNSHEKRTFSLLFVKLPVKGLDVASSLDLTEYLRLYTLHLCGYLFPDTQRVVNFQFPMK